MENGAGSGGFSPSHLGRPAPNCAPVGPSLRAFLLLALLALPPGAGAAPCTEPGDALSAVVTGTTSGLGTEFGSCGGAEAPETAVSFLPPRSGRYVFDTVGSGFDTVLYARDGEGTERACNDDIEVGFDSRSRLTVDLVAGQPLTLYVDGFAANEGDFVLRINPDCPRPFRQDPRDLGSALRTTRETSLACAPELEIPTACGSSTALPGISFVYTAPASGQYRFTTEGSEIATALVAQLGSCTGTVLACDPEPGIPTARVEVELTAGQTVVLTLLGRNGARGPVVLNVDGVPHSPTPSATRTATRTPTPSAVPSLTPVPVATATHTPSRTATPSPSATPSRTPIPQGCCQRPAPLNECAPVVAANVCAGLGGRFVENGVCRNGNCEPADVTPTRTPEPSPTEAASTRTATASATPTRTSTISLPSPTVSPTATPSRPAQSPSLTPPATLTPSPIVPPVGIDPLPDEAARGGFLDVRGQAGIVAPGVRLFWESEGSLLPVLEATVAPDGRFSSRLPILPSPGPARLCAATIGAGTSGADLSCRPISIVRPRVASLTGSVRGPDGRSLEGARLLLLDRDGVPVGDVLTDATGSYGFFDLAPGAWELAASCPEGACDGEDLFFPTRTVLLGPGAVGRSDLTGSRTGPVAALRAIGGAFDVPEHPRLLHPADSAAGRIAAFPGLGLPPLPLRLWAIADFATDVADARLLFELQQGDRPLAAQTATQESVVLPGEARLGFSAWVTEWNALELPAGELRWVISALADGRVVAQRTLRVAVEDLGQRWPSLAADPQALTIRGEGSGGLEYVYTPARRSVEVSLDTVDGRVPPHSEARIDLRTEERWRSEGRWEGRTVASIDGRLLGAGIEPREAAFHGPSGDDLRGAGYALSTVTERGACTEGIFPVVDSPLSALPCEGCSPVAGGAAYDVDLCFSPYLEAELVLAPDLRLSGNLRASLSTPPTLSLSSDSGLCGGVAVVQPVRPGERSRQLPTDPDAPPPAATGCLRQGVLFREPDACAGSTVVRPDVSVSSVEDGCPAGSPPATAVGNAFPVAGGDRRVAVTTDGAGGLLHLWIEPNGAGSRLGFRHLRNGNVTRGEVTTTTGWLGEPQSVAIGRDRVLLVWVQSEAVGGPQNARLWFSMWNAGDWSAPRPFTESGVANARPALAGNAITGRASLVWLQGRRDGGGSVVVRAASHDGEEWQPAVDLGPAGPGVPRSPSVTEDALGRSAAAWTTVDGSGQTRTFLALGAAGEWSAVRPVFSPPASAHSVSVLRDATGSAWLAFVVPTRAGQQPTEGNKARLQVLRVTPDGDEEMAALPGRGERPRLLLDPEGRPRVVWRRFADTEGRTDGIVLGTRDPDSGEWRTVPWPGNPPAGPFDVTCAADAPGCQLISGVSDPTEEERSYPAAWLPNLAILPGDVVIEPAPSLAGSSRSVTVRITNLGLTTSPAEPTEARLRVAGGRRGSAVLESALQPGESIPLTIPVSGDLRANEEVWVMVDEDVRRPETRRDDNRAGVPLRVPAPPRLLSASFDRRTRLAVLRWEAESDLASGSWRIRRRVRGGSLELIGVVPEPRFEDPFPIEPAGVEYHVTTVAPDGSESEAASLPVPAESAGPGLPCPGDCDGDGAVTIAEVLRGVNIALETLPLTACPAFDTGGDGAVQVPELLQAVRAALDGCPTRD